MAHESIFDDPELAALIGEGVSSPGESATDVEPKLDDTIRNLLEEADKIVHHERAQGTISGIPTGHKRVVTPPRNRPEALAPVHPAVASPQIHISNPPTTRAPNTEAVHAMQNMSPVSPDSDGSPFVGKTLHNETFAGGAVANHAGEQSVRKTASQESKPPLNATANAAVTTLTSNNGKPKEALSNLMPPSAAQKGVFSMEEEDALLQDILKTLAAGEGDDDEDDFDDVEVGSDGIVVKSQIDKELEAALAYAERIAMASGNEAESFAQGLPVLRIQESQLIRNELEKARTTAGTPSCVDNCIKWAAARRSKAKQSQQSLQSNSPVIAIGTTLGMILLFSSSHKMRGVCGSSAAGPNSESKGATTAVTFSQDGTTIAAGYESGHVTLWDTDTLHPLKSFDNEFPFGVVKITFCHPESHKFVAMDAAGNVKVFYVNSVMGKHVGRSTTIHTGYESPCSDVCVTTDQVPVINAQGQPEGVKDLNYVATICQKHFSVFTVAFGLQTTVSLAFSSDAPRRTGAILNGPSHERMAWIEDKNQRKLVICWTNIIEVYHVFADAGGQVTLQRTAQLDAPRPMIVGATLDGCCVLFVDDESKLHVFDASHNVIVQTLQLKGKFEFITFGFNVPSDVPTSSGASRKKHKYYGLLSHSGGTVTLQGKSRFAQCFLKTWEERIDELLHAGQWEDLFTLMKELSQDMAVAVVGLSAVRADRKASIHRKIEELMNAYITQMDAKLKNNTPLSSGETPPNYNNAHLVPVIDQLITFCSEIQLQDFFFSCVMPRLEELRASDRGLYALEDALNNGKLKTIPPVYISNFAKLFRSPARLASVNRADSHPIPPGISPADHALQRMEVALTNVTNDLDLLTRTAETLKLYRLLCCILSFRQHKHVDALKAVLPDGGGNTGSIQVAFEYLERLFDDQSLIDNEPIIPWYRKSAKENVIEFLVTDPKALNELLKCDATRLLSIASTLICPPPAPSATDAGNTVWASERSAPEAPSSPWTSTAKVTRSQFALAIYSQLIDASIPANKPWEYERKKWPNYATVLQTYVTLSSPFSNKLISFPSQTATDDFLLRASYHFTYAFEKSNLERRSSITAAFVKIITSSQWNPAQSISIENEVKAKRLGRAHAALLSVRGEYSDAIACFLGRDYNQVDPFLSQGVFQFIISTMKELSLKNEQGRIESMRMAIKDHLGNLIHVDAVQLSQLVFEYLPDDHNEVFRALQGIGDNTFLLYMRGMMAKGDRSVNEDKYTQNMYIGLMCKHEPNNVYDYLVRNDTDIQYDLAQALHDCQDNSITDATIFLLEKTMQIAQAIEALMSSVTEHLLALRQSVIEQPTVYHKMLFPEEHCQNDGDKNTLAVSNSETHTNVNVSTSGNIPRALLYDNDKSMKALSPQDSALIKMVNLGIDLCSRYNNKLAVDDLKVWWFKLLDRFATPKRLLHDRQSHFRDGSYQQHHYNPNLHTAYNGFEDNEVEMLTRTGNFPLLTRPLTGDGVAFLTNMQAVYARYISHILTAMVKTLPLSTVVGKIVEDNQRDQFGPFKPIIVGILETLSFDLEANRLCKLCADGDTMLIAQELRKTATAALIPASTECGICNKHLSVVIGDVDSLRLYPCGHGFHEICCGSLTQCYFCSRYEEIYGEGAIGGAGEDLDNIPIPNKEASKSANAKKAAEPQNIDFIMRRLRHLRGKLDNTKVYQEMLDSIVDSDGAKNAQKRENSGANGGILVDGVNIADIDTKAFGGGKNLLLSPPPAHRFLALEDVIEDRKPLLIRKNSKVDEELTDEDLIAILGKRAYDAMRASAEDELSQQQVAWAEEEEDWGDDALRELMNK